MVQSLCKNKLTPGFKNYMRNLDKQTSQKSWNLMGYLCPKNTFFLLKHYIQRFYLTLLLPTCVKIHQITYVICEAISHFSRRNSSVFYFSTAQMKFHQLCTLIGSFCWKYIKFQLKSTEELCLMTPKSNAKSEEKTIRCFKNDKNLVNFNPSTQRLENLQFDWSFSCKVCNVWPKKYRGCIFHDTEEPCKI